MQTLKPSVLFVSLTTFKGMGGIEKFNRAFLKALQELQPEMVGKVYGASVHDTDCDEHYFNPSNYTTANGSKPKAILQALQLGAKADIIILGHINLAIIGVLIKALFPSKKIWLAAHGIDVWEKQTGLKARLLKSIDRIIAVSQFTKTTMAKSNDISLDKISLLHNCIDPYFKHPIHLERPQYLEQRYNAQDRKILYTLTRLASGEKYKGYDVVIECLPELKKTYTNLLYIIGGKADQEELLRIQQLISEKQVTENVILTGFIADEELVDHYLLADVFVMPSKGEGFGIVFIEAAACGTPVIAGNKDGSVDALKNGLLGELVNPYEKKEIEQAIIKSIEERPKGKDLSRLTSSFFHFDTFKAELALLITHLN